MRNRLSIRWELTFFILMVVSIVLLGTLFTVQIFQKYESRNSAIAEAETIAKSLNNDLLKAILYPSTDLLSDIDHRLSAFKRIDGLILLNEEKNSLYRYGETDKLKEKKERLFDKELFFTQAHLLIKKPLSADGHVFGYALLDINLTQFNEKQKIISQTILGIFPFALLLGFLVSFLVSKNYTKPFTQLIEAMKESRPTQGQVIITTTDAKNEIADLFDGFNSLMKQVSDSSKMLHFQAEHDQLTGLYNRFGLERVMKEEMAKKTDTEHALIAIDLDQFKLINDSVGYAAGDMFLKMFVAECQKHAPKEHFFARLDGDSFLLVILNKTKEESVRHLMHLRERLSDVRFSWDNRAFSVSAGMGLVSFKPFEYALDELTKLAAAALANAKAQGKNKVYIYEKEDNSIERYDREVKVANFIKEALDDGESRFELFAQAIIPLQYESEKVSYEILIRMWDKEGNFVPPNDFLPTAERYQLMTDIDIHVLWSYFKTVTKDSKHIEKLHKVHINLAGSSLNNPDFQAKVKDAVDYFSFPWEKLELEVTETSAVGNFSQANDFITWLKSVGIGLALDDFGTGMSSFEYLKSLPFDVVKIDGSFVKDMHTDPTDKAVIKYIQEIAEFRGQETVAEYVETAEDVDALREIGVTYGQGYFLGKPKPLSEWLN